MGEARSTGGRPTPADLEAVDESPVRCFDPDGAEAMIAEVKAAAKDGDSLGGVVEVLGYGVPVGLGSHVHWDRKLDGLLAQAVMSIQAVKGVELGDGFDVAARRGSVAHDAIRWDEDAGAYRRDTTLAGGVEGGMSTGELLVVRAAMKPLATLNGPCWRPSTRRRRRRRSRSRSAPTSPPCRRWASSPRRWSPSSSPPRRCASSAATRSPSSSATPRRSGHSVPLRSCAPSPSRSASAATTCTSVPGRSLACPTCCPRGRGASPSSRRRRSRSPAPSCALLGDRELTRIDIGAGEESKSLVTVEHLARAFARAGLTRDDVVVAVGGGMVTDVAGFAAAVWHRGIAVVHVATSLLAMVDAAIGGKTGVNLPEGKNLVGAFWQPAGVICDTDALATLPPRERRSGDGEMAKYHFLTGDDLDALPLDERIARCVEIKAAVVAADEREGDADEPCSTTGTRSPTPSRSPRRTAVTHGEAVGIGLVYAAELAAALGRIDAGRVADHRAVVGETYELPTTIPAGTDDDQLLELMGRDKKARDGLTFVLDGPRGVEVVGGVDPAVARAALAAVR